MVKKIKILWLVFMGYIMKLLIDLNILRPRCLKGTGRKQKIIVSLTSYGRRVTSNVIYYTLVSLLRQSYQPDKIVVWLDNDHFNKNNIPPRLKSLTKYGVEYGFCEDLKSFKKLLPSLKKYPEDVIITVDDDYIYRKDLIESLVKAHDADKNRIISRLCRFPKVINGNFASYNEWTAPYKTPETIEGRLPIGVSGILYPPHCFDDEIFNKEAYMKLCPQADDLWFWVMACRNGSLNKVIAQNQSVGCSFDILHQFLHKGSALNHSNMTESANDVQLRNLMKHYNLTTTDLCKI